jgi:thioredoxin reductase
MKADYDVVIVGGGPSGLAAALTMGRALRRVLLVDGGTPRNARAHEVHNFVTRDGTPPAEFRRIAREQLAKYETVKIRDALVTGAKAEGAGFVVSIGEEQVTSRALILGVGVVDEPPAIAGMDRHWGYSVFACPYCHGYEVRDRPWGVLATNDALADWSIVLRQWTSRLVAFTQGAALSAESLAKLERAGIAVENEPIASLEGEGELTAVKLRSGRDVPCGALFVRPAQKPTALVTMLGLALDEMGYVRVDASKESSVKRVFVPGDAGTMRQAAIGAASDGTFAAAMLNHDLASEDFGAQHG